MKKFDHEDEPNEFMEMPCQCGCGKWFDLNDGHRSIDGKTTLCFYCSEREHEDFDPDEDSFQPCDGCDLPDACADHGRAKKQGIRKPAIGEDGVF